MNFERTFDLIQIEKFENEERSFLYNKTETNYDAWSSKMLVQQYLSYCYYLREQNLQVGEMVVMMPQSASIHWVLFDLAIQAMGAVVVMAHGTLSSAQLNGIFEETRSKFFVYSNPEFEEKHRSLLNGKLVIQVDKLLVDQQMSIEDYGDICRKVKETDLSTIIYTSGTTGIPKGVMLSHFNIMSNVQSVTLLLPIQQHQKVLSFLPYSHIFERTSIYCLLALQCNTYFIGRPQNLADALPKIKPHFFTAVPRILERMYDQVVSEFKSRKWLGKKVFNWASRVSENYKPHKSFNPIKFLQIRFIRWFLLGKFRKRLGGNIEAILVGAAHLRPEIAKAFYAAGINVREGYGMTETSPAISINRFEPGLNRFGTVGLPLPNVQIDIRDQDENGAGIIWVKGPNIMQGYYKRPEETSKVLTEDGWLCTGDVGILRQGFLTITDRQKDIFKTSSGKYVAPQELENHYVKSDLIENIMIIGFKRQFVSALIYPNFTALEQWSKEHNIHWTSPQYMVLNIKVQDCMKAEIEIWNEQVPNYKRVNGFYLMHVPWSVESGQLSNTLKPIRKKILADYEKEVEEIYL